MKRTIITSVTTLLLGHLLFTALPVCAQATRPAAQSRPAAATRPARSDKNSFAKWEKDIAAYEAMDRQHPVAKGGVLFIGSSTIVLWKTLEKDFPDHKVINRGFGGSFIEDSTHFAERIIFPYEPRIIVLRSGGNDVHSGKSPEDVFEDYKAFVTKVHARLPKTQVVYISNNPAPSRWATRGASKALNTLIEKFIRQHPNQTYVEIYDMTLGADGQPRLELYAKDKLHFSAEGYRLLADCVRKALPK